MRPRRRPAVVPMSAHPEGRQGEHVPANFDTVATWEPPDGEGELDPRIAFYVRALRAGGFETLMSCEGGHDHAWSEAFVDFAGDATEGLRALAWALKHNFPVEALHRIWRVKSGELQSAVWRLTLFLAAGVLERTFERRKTRGRR